MDVKQKILEENIGYIDDITDEDIKSYAKQLGIDVNNEKHLLWIAKEGIQAPLPYPWCPVEDENNRIYYYNKETGKTSWSHPADQHYEALVKLEKEKEIKCANFRKMKDLKIDNENLLKKKIFVLQSESEKLPVSFQTSNFVKQKLSSALKNIRNIETSQKDVKNFELEKYNESRLFHVDTMKNLASCKFGKNKRYSELVSNNSVIIKKYNQENNYSMHFNENLHKGSSMNVQGMCICSDSCTHFQYLHQSLCRIFEASHSTLLRQNSPSISCYNPDLSRYQKKNVEYRTRLFKDKLKLM